MHLITFTNLYPGEDSPRHGIFVRERLRQLIELQGLSAFVVALRPRRPGAATPHFAPDGTADDTSGRLRVRYTPVPTVPRLSNWVDPWLWARAAEPIVRNAVASCGSEVVLDGHFLYPDGAAAVLLARRLGLPVVLTARGSDVNVKCHNPVMRAWVRWAAARSNALITVSQALADKLRSFAISSPVIEAIPNGVDLVKFRPIDRDSARRELNVGGQVIVSVGHLLEAKGHQLAIAALRQLPEVTLLIVGEGPDEATLRRLASELGVADRVRFPGLIRHEQMPAVYSAADALVLMSAREGMPNVLLESLACGTRVIANNVGGVPEVVQGIEAGVITRDRSADALVAAFRELEEHSLPRQATRQYAKQFSWESLVARQAELYRRVASEHEAQDAN